MVDTKIKDLTPKTTVVATDEVVANDVAGGNLDKKLGLDDIKTFMSDTPTLLTPVLGTPSAGTIDMANVTITGTSAEFQTANSDGSFVMLAGSQTITGTKTLNSFKGTGAITVTNILDEDNMATDSATALATQQSIKAYADSVGGLSNIVEDTTPQLGGDLDANGFDINIDAGFLLTFDTGTQAQKIVGDVGGLTHTVPTGDTHDFIVNATTTLALSETAATITGTLAVSGIIDAPDIELGTFSARDGSLAGTIADSTGVTTFVSGAVLVAPVLGTPASGTMTNVTGLPITGITSSTSAEIATLCSDETGSSLLVFNTSPTLVTPLLGTPTSGVLTNCTGLPVTGLADGTDGELITWSAIGVAETVAVGTATEVLTSNGVGVAPTFQAAAGGVTDATYYVQTKVAGLSAEKLLETVRLTADQTVNNTTTLVNITDLVSAVNLEANKDYFAVIGVLADGGTTPDIKIGVTAITGATIIVGSLAGANEANPQVISTVGAGTVRTFSVFADIEMGATAAKLQLQFAQNTADVSDTKVIQGMTMMIFESGP